MGKPDIPTEWIVCESDAEWEDAQGDPILYPAETVQPARFETRRWQWAAAATVLLVLLITGAWVWRTSQRGLDAIHTELYAGVDQEMWEVQQGKNDLPSDLTSDLAIDSQVRAFEARTKHDRALLKGAVTNATGGELIANLEILRLHENRAVIRVFFQIGDESYRQTRVYHKSVEGWQQVPADADSLGEWRQLETDHLTIGYFELDEVMVKEAAPRLEAFFSQAQLDFGVTGAEKESRYGIVITPEGVFAAHEQAMEEGLSKSATHIISPSFQLLSAAASDADALLQAAAFPILFPIVQNAIIRARHMSEDRQKWMPLLTALRLWEFWQSDVPLAEWKDEIVVLEMQGERRQEYVAAACHVICDEICEAYRLWSHSPSQMAIPLNCESTLREPYPTAEVPDTLNDLLAPRIYCRPVTTVCQEPHEVGLTTVLDYVVVRYGRQQLPVLVGALGEHDRWETLIPAVFGVLMEEFERGWQLYLAENS